MSIDVYSLNIEQCKNIYPLKLIRPLRKKSVDPQQILRQVVDDLLNNGFRILHFVGDNPKRSEAKQTKGHASWFPCEYCFAKGTKIEISDNCKVKRQLLQQKKIIEDRIKDFRKQPRTEEIQSNIRNLLALNEDLQRSINSLKRRSHILWPASTMNAENRSRQSILEIVEKIEGNEILSIDEARGIIGRSVLFDIPEFNFVYDSPAEYLHSGCLGVVKNLVRLTFNVGGEKKKRITKRKLSSTANFNRLMICTKVPREFSRRARKLDFAVFKGQEFRNLILFFFPLVLECIEPEAKEIDLWLHLSYLFRASCISSEEFRNINLDVIHESCQIFYKTFEQLFGEQNCPYNLHVFITHLMEIRTHGPLTKTSAFKFESFYGEIRRSFVPGTSSPLKQIMKNIFLKRNLCKHHCENEIFISNYDTPLESNSIIYTYVRKKYKVYKISEIENNIITCHKIGQYPAIFKQTPNIDWSTVGVFRKGGISSEVTQLSTSDICGKVLNVGKYLITCPLNVLREK